MKHNYQRAYRGIRNDIFDILNGGGTWGATLDAIPYLDEYNITDDFLDEILYNLDCEGYIEFGANHGYFSTYQEYGGEKKELFLVTKFADNYQFKNFYTNIYMNDFADYYDEIDDREDCHLNDIYDLVVVNKTDFKNISLDRLKNSAGVIYQIDDLKLDRNAVVRLNLYHIPLTLLDDKKLFAADYPTLNATTFAKNPSLPSEIIKNDSIHNAKYNFYYCYNQTLDKVFLKIKEYTKSHE